jgi:uncharacterized protein (TIGR02001 family)
MTFPMKKAVLAAALVASALPAFAQSAPAWSITGNAGLYSDYRFRGISQTNKKPAFQGGFDIAHSSGFYAGNWNSNVDAGFYNGANIEMDFYGGFKGAAGDFSYDVGVLYYYYPGSGAGGTFKIDNTEIYVGGGYGPFTLKYSHAVSDFFGIDDSKNSYYLDAGFTWPISTGFNFVAHVGYQGLKDNARVIEIDGSGPHDSIVDWKVGVTYDLSGWALGASYIGTNRDLTGGIASLNSRNLSDGTVVVSVGKSF